MRLRGSEILEQARTASSEPETERSSVDAEVESYAEEFRNVLRQAPALAVRSGASLVREMATQRAPLPAVLEGLWTPFVEWSPPERERNLDSLLRLQRSLASAFEHISRMDRSAHTRLASAYAQKTREVDALIETLPAIAFLKDAGLRYTSVNREFCKALRVSPEDVIHHTDEAVLPAEIARRLREEDEEVLKARILLQREELWMYGDKERTLLLTRAPVLDSQGAITGLIGLGFDITERKEMERELARQAAALKAIGEVVFVTGADGAIQYVNPAFSSVTGYTPEEAMGRNPRILKSGRQDAEFYEQLWAALLGGETWTGTLINRRKNGEEYYAQATLSPVKDSEGSIASFVAVQRDISEQKRVMEQLRQALMVKTDFTSMVSHELRTPLAAIKEAISVVADGTAGEVNENQEKFLNLAKRNVDRLHRLINDTLDFSKLERGDFRLELGWHELNKLAQEIVSQQRLAAEKKGIRLETSLDETVGRVRLDSDRISQVLVNLLNNAIRYCNGPWVRVSTERQGHETVVKVEDSGPGIPEPEKERIFEAFVQLSSGPGRKAGGSGLGLAICKRLIDLHGGRIWVDSEVGRGSAFCFALPAAPPNEAGENTEPAAHDQAGDSAMEGSG